MISERQLAMKIEQRFWDSPGDRIRNARLAKGFKAQKDFQAALEAVGTSLSLSAISQMESDIIVPSTAVLKAFREVLGKSIDWLLCLPEEQPEPEPEPYTQSAQEIAALIDSLPLDIKEGVVSEIRQLLQDRYDAFDRNRRYNELMTLISERGGPDILDSVKRIISKDNKLLVRKGIDDSVK